MLQRRKKVRKKERESAQNSSFTDGFQQKKKYAFRDERKKEIYFHPKEENSLVFLLVLRKVKGNKVTTQQPHSRTFGGDKEKR